MAERRSLGDAIALSPEKLAFIHGQNVASVPPAAGFVAETPIVAATIDLEASSTETRKEDRPRSARQTNRGRAGGEAPEASKILDQVLVPVTIRLQHRTAQALRRAYLEQRLKHAKPDTQQEIVEEALGEWLARQGFLAD